jgi:hypothetical protein
MHGLVPGLFDQVNIAEVNNSSTTSSNTLPSEACDDKYSRNGDRVVLQQNDEQDKQMNSKMSLISTQMMSTATDLCTLLSQAS